MSAHGAVGAGATELRRRVELGECVFCDVNESRYPQRTIIECTEPGFVASLAEKDEYSRATQRLADYVRTLPIDILPYTASDVEEVAAINDASGSVQRSVNLGGLVDSRASNASPSAAGTAISTVPTSSPVLSSGTSVSFPIGAKWNYCRKQRGSSDSVPCTHCTLFHNWNRQANRIYEQQQAAAKAQQKTTGRAAVAAAAVGLQSPGASFLLSPTKRRSAPEGRGYICCFPACTCKMSGDDPMFRGTIDVLRSQPRKGPPYLESFHSLLKYSGIYAQPNLKTDSKQGTLLCMRHSILLHNFRTRAAARTKGTGAVRSLEQGILDAQLILNSLTTAVVNMNHFYVEMNHYCDKTAIKRGNRGGRERNIKIKLQRMAHEECSTNRLPPF
jgi:hypothetical protein